MRQVALQVSVANAGDSVDTKDIVDSLLGGNAHLEAFRLTPPPGSIWAAGLEFTLVLGAVGSVASIASLLWQTYERFIKPHKESKPTAGLVISIRCDDGSSAQFWLGHVDKDRDIFIRTFCERITKIRNSTNQDGSTESILNELRTSRLWVSYKPRV